MTDETNQPRSYRVNIPDEAVAAAVYAVQEACETYDPGGWTEEENWAIWTRRILEAAAPFMSPDFRESNLKAVIEQIATPLKVKP